MQLQSHQSLGRGGYTLIEILIVLTIVGILFALGTIGFRDFARRQVLASAVRAVRGDLRLAQEQAIAGNKPQGCNTLSGYEFRVESLEEYAVGAVCTNGTCATNADYCIRTGSLPSGISLAGSKSSLTFKVLGLGVSFPSPGTRVDLTITDIETGRNQIVTVTAAGEIR